MLLSLQPQWTAAILDGRKTVNLRRAPSGCRPGTPLLIYTSHPVRRLQAVATVAAVHAEAPDALWERVGDRCAMGRDGFDTYLHDTDVAYGIELTDVRALPDLDLGFRGPQSWRYLYADEPAHLPLLRHAGLA